MKNDRTARVQSLFWRAEEDSPEKLPRFSARTRQRKQFPELFASEQQSLLLSFLFESPSLHKK
ncbi:MAG: hypothetical protein IJZ75_01445 [Clostridia bacterium]|nr:hypothetical protein [Clostridia bacterium]